MKKERYADLCDSVFSRSRYEPVPMHQPSFDSLKAWYERTVKAVIKYESAQGAHADEVARNLWRGYHDGRTIAKALVTIKTHREQGNVGVCEIHSASSYKSRNLASWVASHLCSYSRTGRHKHSHTKKQLDFGGDHTSPSPPVQMGTFVGQ